MTPACPKMCTCRRENMWSCSFTLTFFFNLPRNTDFNLARKILFGKLISCKNMNWSNVFWPDTKTNRNSEVAACTHRVQECVWKDRLSVLQGFSDFSRRRFWFCLRVLGWRAPRGPGVARIGDSGWLEWLYAMQMEQYVCRPSQQSQGFLNSFKTGEKA